MNQHLIWDALYRNNLTWKKETINLPKLLKNKKVLELGCGTSKTLCSILRQSPREIDAIDFSESAVEKVKSIFPKLNVMKANATNMPFDNNSFDIVVCYYILNNSTLKIRKKIANEIHRVLKNKGKLLFEDFSPNDFRNKGKKYKEKNTIIKKNGLIFHFFTGKEIQFLFNKFSSIKIKTKSSKPIKNHPEVLREIISAIIIK